MPRRDDEEGSKARRRSARKTASGSEQRPAVPSRARGSSVAGRVRGGSKRLGSEAPKAAPGPKATGNNKKKAPARPKTAAGAKRPARPEAPRRPSIGRGQPKARGPAARKKAAGKVEPSAARPAKVADRDRSAVVPPGPKTARRRAPGLEAGAGWPAGSGPQAAPGTGAAALTDEERIGSAKYTPRELPPRLFEEERFLFPDSYGADRVRLLVRDPEWLFAYWDLDPRSQAALRTELGERAGALSRLSLRVFDPQRGGMEVILLPDGARAWYVRTDPSRRTYRAELGFTLPSGEFRRLALSNLVSTPSGRPSRQRARRRASYKRLHGRAAVAGAPLAPAPETESGPSGPVTLVDARPGAHEARGARGGASDVLGPARPRGGGDEDRPGAGDARGGASDAFRPGASDAFERRGPDRR
jgi:hypothetical protein